MVRQRTVPPITYRASDMLAVVGVVGLVFVKFGSFVGSIDQELDAMVGDERLIIKGASTNPTLCPHANVICPQRVMLLEARKQRMKWATCG